VVADYLTANRPYAPKLDGRITHIAAKAAAAPAGAEPAAGTSAAAPEEHVIEAGDNYWKLAEKIYGSGMKWKAIADANPQYKPKRLPIGAMLKMPPSG
jgi:5'-nucleotidase/UDP-sugar diphosphatase